MLKQLFSFLVFLFGITQVFAQSSTHFRYEIEPVLSASDSYFNVSIEFKKKEQGGMRFVLPQVWGMDGSSDFIDHLSVKNAEFQQNKEYISIKFKKNASVRITYRLNNTIKDSIPARGEEYMPTIKPTYFTLFSNSAFITPEDNSGTKHHFSIRWKNYPEQYSSEPITSFGNGLKQELDEATVADFLNAIIVGGDYRLYNQTNQHKQKTQFAIRGKWSFKDEDLAKLVESTLTQQRKFWDDYSTKNYLITVSAGGYENEFEQSYTGTGLHNSFAVTAVCNSTTQVNSLYYLFHHELMHHWIGHQIQNGADEELSYWFSEGFTEYFCRKNMFESGLISEREYVQLLDSILAVHYSNPLATAINDSIKPNFWGRSYYGKLPYNRGSIYAYYLDGKIQRISKGQYSLKDIMRIMLSETKLDKRQFDWKWMQQEISQLINYDITNDIERYIFKGELIPIDELNKNLGEMLELRSTKIASMGFTTEKDATTEKTYVKSITPNSGASTSGLKIGDEIVGYSIFGNVTATSEVYVKREGKEIPLPFQAYVLSEPVPQHIRM